MNKTSEPQPEALVECVSDEAVAGEAETSLSEGTATASEGQAGRTERVPWGPLDAFLVLAVCGIAFTIFGMISAIPAGIELATGSSLVWLKRAIIIGSMFSTYMVNAWIVLTVAILVRKGTLRQLGFKPFKLAHSIALIAFLFMATRIFNGGYAYFISRFGTNPPSDQMTVVDQVFGGGLAGMLLAFALTVVVAPIVEELVFRGFVYPAIRKKIGAWPSIAFTGALFGLIHLDFYLFLPLAVIGFALGWLYEKTDSIGPPILLHAINNLVAVVALYASVNMPF